MSVDNYTDAVRYIARRLGNRTDLNTFILEEMRIAQTELERMPSLPWFLVTTQYSTLIANYHRIPIPTTFLREYEDGALWRMGADCSYHKLIKTHIDVLKELMNTSVDNIGAFYSPGEDTEAPRYYQLAGDAFHVAPPAAVDTMMMLMFYKTAGVLGDSDDLAHEYVDTNLWLERAPEALMSRTGMRMSQYLAAPELYAMFSAQHADAMKLLEVENNARYMENFETSMCMGGT